MIKNLFCIISVCCMFIGCSNTEKLNDNNIKDANETNAEVVSNVEEVVPMSETVKELELTYTLKEIANNEKSAEVVYICDTMDNYGETVTVIPGMYNNTSQDMSNIILVFKFYKGDEIILEQEIEVEGVCEANSFKSIGVFLAEIPITDFDKIEVNMKL